MSNESINELVSMIDLVDSNSKLVSNITGVAKSIIAKDPNALDNNLLESIIKNHLGESMYDRIRKAYNEFIGT